MDLLKQGGMNQLYWLVCRKKGSSLEGTCILYSLWFLCLWNWKLEIHYSQAPLFLCTNCMKLYADFCCIVQPKLDGAPLVRLFLDLMKLVQKLVRILRPIMKDERDELIKDIN